MLFASVSTLLATLWALGQPQLFELVPRSCPEGAHSTEEAIPSRMWASVDADSAECVCDAPRSRQVVGLGILVPRQQYVQVGHLQLGPKCIPFAEVLEQLCQPGLTPYVEVHNGDISPQELREGTPYPAYIPRPWEETWSDPDHPFPTADDLGLELIEVRCVDRSFRPHGLAITWDARGPIKRIGRFGYNGPVGEWRMYHSNLRNQRIGSYREGRKHGSWIDYTWDGNLERPQCFVDGVYQPVAHGAPCPP